ncbi:hypothetical protein JCM5350_002097 [Sporobolomyces pararoseus]
MSFSKLARVAMDSITDTLLVLFPPTPLPLSPTSSKRNKQVIETFTTTTRTRTVASQRSNKQEPGLFATMAYSLTGNYPDLPRSLHLPSLPPTPPRTYPSLDSQLEKNSYALSLEQPIKSCFRRCKANKLFSLPTSPSPSIRPSSSNISRRRVVFADPIDDGGNNPQHPRLALPEEELEKEDLEEERLSSTRFRSSSRDCSSEPEISTLSIQKRRSTSSTTQSSSCPNLPSSVRKQRAIAISTSSPSPQPSRRYSTISTSTSSTPQTTPSRLRLPPLAGYERRQRVVAYTFYFASSL